MIVRRAMKANKIVAGNYSSINYFLGGGAIEMELSR